MANLKSSCDLMPSAKCPTIYSLGIFRGLKFHESIKCAKFTEFKYLENTNYMVLICLGSFDPKQIHLCQLCSKVNMNIL